MTCALLALCAPRARAQQAVSQRPPDDSAIVKPVVDAILAEMIPEFSEFVRAPVARSWSITVPEGAEWKGTADGVRHLLHARAAGARDTLQFFLRITRRLRSDTSATYDVEVGRKWRCEASLGRWVFSNRNFDVVARRTSAQLWEVTRGPVLVGDPAPC